MLGSMGSLRRLARWVLAATTVVMVVAGPIPSADAADQSDCVPGKFFDGGACVPCPGGTYQSAAAQTECLDAHPGHDAPRPGADVHTE